MSSAITMHDVQPSFVMTLQLDAESFAILQQWRTRYFPAALNFIPAHLTLFHKISSDQLSRLRESWSAFAPLAPVRLQYTAPRLLGNGVAIGVESVELQALRARLKTAIAGSLTHQDQRPFRPHVTIQNKVAASEARDLHQCMGSYFKPWDGTGQAVLAWAYLGGPWQLDTHLGFDGAAAQP